MLSRRAIEVERPVHKATREPECVHGQARAVASRRRRRVVALCLGACVTVAPAAAWASTLLMAASGAADNATLGTRVADPPTPSAALFENPAGLTRFDKTTITSSVGLGYGWARVDASAPAGYDDTNDVLMMVPDVGLAMPYGDRWRFAVGAYGTTGAQFDFAADPALGVPSFFSETIIAGFPLGVAYRIDDRLSIGAEIQPLFGQLRTHFTAGGLDFRYKVNGPGLQGMVGATVRPAERWTVGLSVRTPGLVWMRGSMPVADNGRQDVSLDAEMPTQVFLGATWRCTERLSLSSSLRFTDASTLGRSTIEYELTPQANSGFVPDAQDEWKVALAAEYAVQEHLLLRLAASYATPIVGSRGVNPLIFDGQDIRIAAGVGWERGPWVIDTMAGYGLPAERHISSDEALVLPGTYRMEGVVFMLGVTYRR